jgi:hypothetical protein
MNDPTAWHDLAEAHETEASSPPSAADGIAVGTAFQVMPLNTSEKGCEPCGGTTPEYPTATHEVDEMQDTDSRSAFVSPAGSRTVSSFQVFPFHDSAKAPDPVLDDIVPTTAHALTVGHEIPVRLAASSTGMS